MLQLFRWKPAIVCLTLLAMSTNNVRAADIDKYLPKETDAVISLNIEQVLASAIVKKNAMDLIKTTLAGNKEVQKAIGAFGIDPLKDLTRISVGLGIALEDAMNPKVVIVVEGKFDIAKINGTIETLARSEPEKFTKDSVNGQTIYKIKTDQPKPIYSAVVDSKHLVFATNKEYLGAAFDASKGTGKSQIKKELSALIEKADSKSSFYLVAATKGKFDAIPVPDANMKKTLEQIHSVTIDLKIEKDVNLELAMNLENEEAAKDLQTQITGGLDFAKIQAKAMLAQQPELEPLIDLVNSMKSSAKEKSVIITGNIDGAAIDKALKK